MKKHGVVAAVCGVLLAWSLSVLAAEALNINSATAKELAAHLVGVGDTKAEAIVSHRQQHGPFRSVDELTAVKGIGDGLLARNRERLTIGDQEASE